MKTTLVHILKTLLRPLLWCRRTILEASEVCWDSDPIGYADYMNFSAPESPRVSRCTIDPRRPRLWKSALRPLSGSRS